ncbi:MAG TPA: hypothetical protein ENK43_00450 [Planctomycetes bacterium]|nr:hypothetical protein [Planctomycetota bacterium]
MSDDDSSNDYVTKTVDFRSLLAPRIVPVALGESLGLLAGTLILVMKPAWDFAGWGIIGVSVLFGVVSIIQTVRNIPCPDCGGVMEQDTQRRAFRCDRCRIFWSAGGRASTR